MVRLLAILAVLGHWLTLPGCIALHCQDSWVSNAPSCQSTAISAGIPPVWSPSWTATLPPNTQAFPMGVCPVTCTPAQPVSADSAGLPVASFNSSTVSQASATIVKLYYGTNRISREDRPDAAGNHYGECEVSIPSQHQFGRLERPSFWRLEFRESAQRHVVLQRVQPLASEECLGRLRGDLAGGDGSAFVFIHGYNVSFADAARRTAQMAFDLQFPGVPLFYSWPSQGKLSGYSADLSTADRSAAQLADFLTQVATETGARQIHLIAHSLGNRALVGALARLGQSNVDTLKFPQVVFAAPDLDAAQFATDIAPRIQPVVGRVTIYSSGSDLALWASRFWHRTTRLGQPSPYWPQIRAYDWIDVIDATSVGFEWFELGHSAYGGALLADLERVIDGRPAGETMPGAHQGGWVVTRPPPPRTLPGGVVPAPGYIFRPAHPWPAAPVDRWR